MGFASRMPKPLRPRSDTTEMNDDADISLPPSAKSRADLFAYLDAHGWAHRTVDHEAVFTVEESRGLKADLPGGHSKNLFLKDKKGALFLAIACAETRVELVGLGKAIGARGRLSFGKPPLMTATLGVLPGAVTPFALLNQTAQALSGVIIDKAFAEFSTVWFHPLENTASTAISPAHLIEFVESCGFEPQLFDLATPLDV